MLLPMDNGRILDTRISNNGHLPPKTVITVPWRVLCVDHVGPYTLEGKDGTIIDCLALTIINPATSWFKVVELPLVC
jgi:hypothetical protein